MTQLEALLLMIRKTVIKLSTGQMQGEFPVFVDRDHAARNMY